MCCFVRNIRFNDRNVRSNFVPELAIENLNISGNILEEGGVFLSMWNPEKEKEFLRKTDAVVWATISCSKCSFSYEPLFKKKSPSKCPECGGKLSSTTPQGRNAPVSNCTEKFACDLISKILSKLNPNKYEAKREIVCEYKTA